MQPIEIFVNGTRINRALYFGDADPARANSWRVDYLYNTEDAESVYAAQAASKTAPVDIEVVVPGLDKRTDDELVFSNKGKVIRTSFMGGLDRPIMARVVFALQEDWVRSSRPMMPRQNA